MNYLGLTHPHASLEAHHAAQFTPTNPYNDFERLDNWAECKYPSLLQPKIASQIAGGYRYRCYGSSLCVGIKGNELDPRYYDDGKQVKSLGNGSSLLTEVPAAGF